MSYASLIDFICLMSYAILIYVLISYVLFHISYALCIPCHKLQSLCLISSASCHMSNVISAEAQLTRAASCFTVLNKSMYD